MKNKTFEIVVSRYNEDITWTQKYNNCKIYNKGDDFDGSYVKLENIGREAHTYLFYIIDNYHTLPDYTFFVQGHPFDHSPNLFETVDNLLVNGFEKKFFWISERIIEGDFEYRREPYIWPAFPNIKMAYEFVFGSEPEFETFLFGAGAQFVVSKDIILSRSLEFYRKLFDFFDKEIGDEYDKKFIKLLRRPDDDLSSMIMDMKTPEMAYYMERFWGIIFNEV